MALELEETAGSKVLVIRVSDKLLKEDYECFAPIVERLIRQYGKVRLLFDMRNFHGWTMRAMWEDIKFDLKHFKDIERLALIGERKWQEWMAAFCRPFTTAEIRYFEHDDADEARNWLDTD